jgi:hypothetical protein
MRKFVLIVLGLLTAGPAFAQNVVNGVDRNSQAYRTAYLKTVDPATCDRNIYQSTGYQGGQRVAVTSLWASDPVQAQACQDSMHQHSNKRTNGDAATGGPGYE